ncbi:hypothetical protein [Clostridium septicum]|uniref:Uncharacterized protein n=1 Tax=Clostridium septicum TaxID=1504 RepID=A0A9N7JP27_CLOSE|nr:hypothetical protein [Clostridium septicum]AYE35574.1 hypothetical protein CP523_14675 [Clostridium septicum]MDU1314997.1 hypothetical protein [Clostridium septicum]QAS60960.1 hypothetical protein EI377_09640 [Clostridium septicum]UEC19762.1 hypothetical protein LK444_10070 [Clostridium septicum]USS02178.1 hypothetical protein NH397_07100 [Clostridium septicum]
MNGYELIMRLQEKMKDPRFAEKFNRLQGELNNIPGLQQEVMRIAQMDNERSRQKAIDRLPDKAKKVMKEILKMLNL